MNNDLCLSDKDCLSWEPCTPTPPLACGLGLGCPLRLPQVLYSSSKFMTQFGATVWTKLNLHSARTISYSSNWVWAVQSVQHLSSKATVFLAAKSEYRRGKLSRAAYTVDTIYTVKLFTLLILFKLLYTAQTVVYILLGKVRTRSGVDWVTGLDTP